MTKKRAYKIEPLERTYYSEKGDDRWKEVSFENLLPKIKMGISEQIVLMLNRNLEKKIKIINLERAIQINDMAEKIFGYE